MTAACFPVRLAFAAALSAPSPPPRLKSRLHAPTGKHALVSNQSDSVLLPSPSASPAAAAAASAASSSLVHAPCLHCSSSNGLCLSFPCSRVSRCLTCSPLSPLSPLTHETRAHTRRTVRSHTALHRQDAEQLARRADTGSGNSSSSGPCFHLPLDPLTPPSPPLPPLSLHLLQN